MFFELRQYFNGSLILINNTDIKTFKITVWLKINK